MELGELTVRAAGEGRWTRAVLLRLDPARLRLTLQARLTPGLEHGAWTVDAAPPGALAAFNAGQFSGIAPWGWTVMDGLEIRPPGVGPLSQAVVLDRAGAVRFVPPDSIETVRAAGGTVTALQSYPSLLVGDAEIPAALTTPGQGVGITHRDARLALCRLGDGRLLLLLTRFDGLGQVGESIPLGLTLAETAELLRGEGCRRAVALDGGISAQLAVRNGGEWEAWRGWRKVPLGVVVERR
jgi:exopolysaccharide biosynthesis protein